MLRAVATALVLAAAAAGAQDAPPPFITDPDMLNRRYGVAPGGDRPRTALPAAEGAAMGREVRPDAAGEIDPRRRARPGAVGSDLVNERNAIVPGSRPFARW